MTVPVKAATFSSASRTPILGNDPDQVGQNSGLLSAAAGLVGVLSYACTLLMANALNPSEFSDYAAGQMLVGIAGVIASALVPLPLATATARHPAGSEARRRGIAFAVIVSLIAGIAAALLAGAITAAFATAPVALAVAASALIIFVVAPTLGWLQGELRFLRYAVVSVGEVAARLAFSLVAVLLMWNAAGAMFGFVVGGLVLLIAPIAFYRDVVWLPDVLRERQRWWETGDIALTQCVLAVLVGADVVIVALLDGGSATAAGFQALATLAKGPIYVAAGTVLVAFPLLRSPGARVDEILTASLRSFGRLALLASAIIATVPVGVAGLVLPDRYIEVLDMLPWLAAAGLGYATLTVLATALLALRAYGRCKLALLVSTIVVLSGLLLGWIVGGVAGLAAGSAIGSLLAAGTVAIIAFPLLPTGTIRMTVHGSAVAALCLLFLQMTRSLPALWLTAVLCASVTVLLSIRGRRVPRHGIDRSVGRTTAQPRLRILYLAAPEPSLSPYRSHEIHRRLAHQHSITVVVNRFPGSANFGHEGVRYVHVGVSTSRLPIVGRISYLLTVPFAIVKFAPDLLVEDEKLPRFLSNPVLTGRPSVRPETGSLGHLPTPEQCLSDPSWGDDDKSWADIATSHNQLYISAIASAGSGRFIARSEES